MDTFIVTDPTQGVTTIASQTDPSLGVASTASQADLSQGVNTIGVVTDDVHIVPIVSLAEKGAQALPDYVDRAAGDGLILQNQAISPIPQLVPLPKTPIAHIDMATATDPIPVLSTANVAVETLTHTVSNASAQTTPMPSPPAYSEINIQVGRPTPVFVDATVGFPVL